MIRFILGLLWRLFGITSMVRKHYRFSGTVPVKAYRRRVAL